MLDVKSKEIKVLLVDDHAVLRKGMVALLDEDPDIVVSGEASDGAEAIAQVKAKKPDVVIMDISMPGINGIDATRQIVKLCPSCKVIALSIHSAKRFVDDMLNAGAVGYMLKESVSEELFQSIKTVMRGEMYLSGSITGTVVEAYVERMSNAGKAGKVSVPPLLLTKLHRPTPPADLVPRQHLLALLDAGRVRPLTLASGPAGYGKSTLISCWLAASDWSSVWLSLDESDSDLHQFLSYVVAAIQNAIPGACKKMQDLINAPIPSSIPLLAACLSNEVELLGQPIVLVLDDYHYINAESEVNTFLHQLLAHPMLSLHLVILSRRDPPLQLVTLRANGQITEVRMSDLRFNLQETRLLLENNSEFIASDEALCNLEKEMEGWVVGLRLVSLVLHKIEDPEVFLKQLNGGVQQAQQYLIQEVLSRQSPQIQNWMLKTSILDRFCAPLCDAVCASDEDNNDEISTISGDIFIEELLDSNLFSISLDPHGEWFRYHHLFQTLLLNELKGRITSDELSELHGRVSDWYEGEGLIEEAINHAMVAKHGYAAAEIFDRHRYAEQNKEKWESLNKRLAVIPEKIKQQHTGLLLAQAWVLYSQTRYGDIALITQKVESLSAENALNEAALSELNFFQGVVSYWEGEGDRCLKYLEGARKHAQDINIGMVGFIDIYSALASYMIGNKNEILDSLNGKIASNELTNISQASYLLIARSYINALSGELSQVKKDAQRSKLLAIQEGVFDVGFWAEYMEANYYYQSQNIETALSCFVPLVEHRYSMQKRLAVDSMVGLALCYQAARKPDAAKKTIETLLGFARDAKDSQNIELALSAQARIAILQNEVEIATEWLHSSSDEINLPQMFIWMEVPIITKARVWIAVGSEEWLVKAIDLLKALRSKADVINNNYQKLQIMVLESIALSKVGRSKESYVVLEEVVEMAAIGNWVSPFLEQGPLMIDLLEHITGKAGCVDHLRFVLEKLSSTADVLPTAINSVEVKKNGGAWVGEPLTNRELDILELLTHRLQNKEIAAKLFVSPETIKSHLKHLYQKLGVSNRREAGIKATEIISSSALGYVDKKSSQ